MRGLILVFALLVLVPLGLAAVEDPVNFGAVPAGTTANATYTFTNSGVFSCTLQAVGFGESYFGSSGPFSVYSPPVPASLPSGGSVEMSITFTPTAVSPFSETLLIRVQCGFFTQTIQVPLLGQGASGGTPYTPIERPLDIVFAPPATDATSEGCPCVSEIGVLESDLDGINLYLLTQLGPSVQQLRADIAELEGCCGDSAPDGASACLGPFASRGGQKFQQFLTAFRRVTAQAADVLPLIDPEQPGLQALLDDGAALVDAMLPDLDELASIAVGLPIDQQACLDSYVPDAAVDFLDTTYTVLADASTHPKLKGLLGGTAQDTGRTILNKVGIWARQIPGGIGGIIGGVIDDIRELSESAEGALGIAGLLFQYELERKLDGIIYGLFGITIPPNATESELEELLRRITSDPVTARLGRLQTGLDGLAQGQAGLSEALDGIEQDVEDVHERVREIERVVHENASELADIEKKICCFVLSMKDYARQMGLALYGEAGAFEFLVPDLCDGVTSASCYQTYSTTPVGADPAFDAIKPEIRALEAGMVVVRERLEEILRRLGGPVLLDEEPPTPTIIVPPELTLEEQQYYWLSMTKKIYVYEEDTFTAASSTDEREVRIATAAFDVSGWVDLYELRSGDLVEIELRVDVAGQDRHFMTTTFDGVTDARLIYFDELSGGRSLLVGDLIWIYIRQTASADGYATQIPIGYQFVVESQD